MAQDRMSEEDMLGDVMTYIKELSQIEDPDLECELETLKLQGAALLYKQRKKALKAAEDRKSQRSSNVGSRCFLPDGKIVVNMTDKSCDNNERVKRELDSNIGAAGGDSTIPGLREQQSSRCVDCGLASQFYCARCEVTPYCSDLCQRRDWPRRHKAVCHNLARLSDPPIEPSKIAPADAIPALPPLRRPRSPVGLGAVRRDVPATHNGDRNGVVGPSSRLANGPSNQGLNKKPYDNEITSSRTSNFKQERPSNNVDEKRNDNRAINGRAPFDNNRKPFDNNRKPFDNNRRTCDNNRQGADNGRQSYDNNRQINKGQGARLVNNAQMDDAEEWPAKKESLAKPVAAAATSPVAPPEVVSIAPDAFAKHASELATMPVKPAAKLARPLAVGKPLVPAKCLMELLEVGATMILSVDFPAASCRVADSAGFVCLCMHEHFGDSYATLCEPECAKLTKGFKPSPGDLYFLFVEEDEAWYRARLLSDDFTSALIDSGAIVKAKPDNMREIPDLYIGLPEFCCLLVGETVKLEDRFMATIEHKSADGACTVSLTAPVDNVVVGKATLKRWLPTVDYPPAPAVTPQRTPPTVEAASTPPRAVIPSVPRPALCAGAELCVLRVSPAGARSLLTVRATHASVTRAYDVLEQAAALEGKTAPLLKDPPKPGDMVLVKRADGVHYRGLVMRTNVKQNKYLVEFVESGITEVATLESLHACPPAYGLEQSPAVSSTLLLHDVSDALSQPATDFLNKLATSAQPLTLTLPNDAKSAPSGSAAILNSNRDNINKRVLEMCKPDWKKLEEKGGDVLESEVLLSTQLEYLPITPGDLQILDSSLLNEGCLSVCAADDKTREHMAYVLGALTERMAEYCESKLGREPYLPRDEELCIARFPPYENWFRALKCEAEEGAGSDNICVLYLDYGNIGRVQAKDLRKMLPEFVRGLPALANTVVIEGFPEQPSAAVMAKLSAAIGIEEGGAGGTISVTKLTQMTPGFYTAVVPALTKVIAGMQ